MGTVIWIYLCTLSGDRYEKVAEGLRIKNVTREDDGEYTCRAEVESDGRYDERKIAVAVHSKLSSQELNVVSTCAPRCDAMFGISSDNYLCIGCLGGLVVSVASPGSRGRQFDAPALRLPNEA